MVLLVSGMLFCVQFGLQGFSDVCKRKFGVALEVYLRQSQRSLCEQHGSGSIVVCTSVPCISAPALSPGAEHRELVLCGGCWEDTYVFDNFKGYRTLLNHNRCDSNH
jgi:hypothetical protein